MSLEETIERNTVSNGKVVDAVNLLIEALKANGVNTADLVSTETRKPVSVTITEPEDVAIQPAVEEEKSILTYDEFKGKAQPLLMTRGAQAIITVVGQINESYQTAKDLKPEEYQLCLDMLEAMPIPKKAKDKKSA